MILLVKSTSYLKTLFQTWYHVYHQYPLSQITYAPFFCTYYKYFTWVVLIISFRATVLARQNCNRFLIIWLKNIFSIWVFLNAAGMTLKKNGGDYTEVVVLHCLFRNKGGEHGDMTRRWAGRKTAYRKDTEVPKSK